MMEKTWNMYRILVGQPFGNIHLENWEEIVEQRKEIL
jgi:hypothetical protein